VIIFHPKENSLGETQEATVAAFDPESQQMEHAVRHGDATVFDLARASYSEDAMETGTAGEAGEAGRSQETGKLINGVPSMKAEAQDVGGLLAPGTQRAL